jgi:mannose-6-phosphate isomerase-like protein (cupin superfamily)
VVLWPGNGSRFRTMQLLKLEPGDRSIDLCHTEDSAYYILAGGGVVRDLADGGAQDLVEGSILHIDRGDRYRFEAGAGGMSAVGGPVPADPALYQHLIEEAAQ